MSSPISGLARAPDATITANGAQIHRHVREQVQDRRLDAELCAHHHPAEHVPRLRDPGVAEHPLQRGLAERACVADDDRDRR